MTTIDQLNASPDVCWLDLTLWDSAEVPSTPPPGEGTADKCKQAAARDGSCYCGKFATQQQLDEWQADTPGSGKRSL